jgi:hypothetical protein
MNAPALPESAPARLEDILPAYQNTGAHNDAFHTRFTTWTAADPLLAPHRAHIEQHHLGFGDPAFHFMWKLLVEHASRTPDARFLEIGVYKGQIISLWALLLRAYGRQARIHAISPMRGSPLPPPWKTRLLNLCSPTFRERLHNGDFYDQADYTAIVRDLLQHFRLEWDAIQLWQGLSQEPHIRSAASTHSYQLIYIDGDHTLRGARADFDFYARLLAPGGFLVADDAGRSLPGSSFWKGHPAVSRAADEILPALGLANILNIGHNRVYRRPA